MDKLISWRTQVIHPTQHATHGGTLKALANLTVEAEATPVVSKCVWALGVDFIKLCNMIPIQVAIRIVIQERLEQLEAEVLMNLLTSIKGIFRLTQKAVSASFAEGWQHQPFFPNSS